MLYLYHVICSNPSGRLDQRYHCVFISTPSGERKLPEYDYSLDHDKFKILCSTLLQVHCQFSKLWLLVLQYCARDGIILHTSCVVSLLCVVMIQVHPVCTSYQVDRWDCDAITITRIIN